MKFKVKQAKLAQPLRGETSNIIDNTQYEITFEGNILNVVKRINPKNLGPFIVFPANIAYIEYENTELPGLQSEEGKLEDRKQGRNHKNG